MNELAKTILTYDQIAASYAEAWAKRGQMHKHMTRFAELVEPNGLIADIGCGAGLDTAVFPQYNLRAVGLDYSRVMMQTGRERYDAGTNFAQADMRRLPLPNGRLAGIWASASLLHLPREDMTAVLQNFNRVLAPGGIFYLSLKQGEGARWTQGAYGHAQLDRFFVYWQSQALDDALNAAKFEIVDGWEESGGGSSWIVRFAYKR